MPETFRYSDLRYKNPPEKGIYWFYFSLHVRRRDVERWGRCISCNREIDLTTAQAGHFMPASNCGRDLLFHTQNVNAECAYCNTWDEAHLLGYADSLDKRYKPGTANTLRSMRDDYRNRVEPLKDFSAAQYTEMISDLPSYQQAKLLFYCKTK